MRLLFFVLVLANVVTLAYFIYHEQSDAPIKASHAPLNPEKIRTVPLSPRDTSNSTAEKLSCWSWSVHQADQTAVARAALDKLGLGDRLTQNPDEIFVLTMDGLKTKRDAEKKLAELRALGIDEVQMIDEPEKHTAHLVLGRFTDEDAAVVRLNQLKEKGVKSTSISKQAGVGARFVIKQANEKAAADLVQLASTLPGSSVKQSACPAS